MAETHLIVTDEGLYVGTGLVNRWLSNITGSIFRAVFIEAPVRSGELRGGLHFSVSHDSLRVLSGIVESTAPHSGFVLFGTANDGEGYIYRDSNPGAVAAVEARLAGDKDVDVDGLWMRLSDARGGSHLRVHGQKANNFLLDGYNRVAARSSALSPMFPGVITVATI